MKQSNRHLIYMALFGFYLLETQWWLFHIIILILDMSISEWIHNVKYIDILLNIFQHNYSGQQLIDTYHLARISCDISLAVYLIITLVGEHQANL